MLALIVVTSFRIDRHGARVEFKGGHVLEYRREVEAETPPSLPPPTFDTTADPAPASRPGLSKCSPSARVVPLRRVG